MPKDLFDELFEDAEIDFDCPQCNYSFRIKAETIFQDGSVVICPNCESDIKIVHDETTKKTMRDAKKATKQLEKTLKDLERTFKKFGK